MIIRGGELGQLSILYIQSLTDFKLPGIIELLTMKAVLNRLLQY